jgi:hypothetical protein
VLFKKDIPTEPGLYWAVKPGSSDPEPVEVEDDGYVRTLEVPTMFTAEQMQELGLLWGDPITLPTVERPQNGS